MMESSDLKVFDVIIIGGGAAGMAAALWCDELGLRALLLESDGELGGQLLWTYNAIKNYPGIEAATGRHLRDIFAGQLASRKFTLKTNSEVVRIDFSNKQVYLKDGRTFSAGALILAAGIRRRRLNVEGEDEFTAGRGIIKSGKRDAGLIKEKRVCVIGGGDAALENSLILAETASEVILVHRRREFRARPEFIQRVLGNKKIRVMTETRLIKITGHEKLEALELENLSSGETIILPVDALLVRIGVEPNTSLFQGNLDMDKNGYLKIDSRGETNISRVFAVGDIANPLSPTISSAVGMGVTAVKVIFDRLSKEA